MKLVLPTILTLCCSVVILLVDPARQRGSMIEPSDIAPSAMPDRVGAWLRSNSNEELPHAYPPHNEVWERVTVYRPQGVETADAAFVRVIIAQDRRDLLAYEPSYAMRIGGWTPEGAEATNGLTVSRHARREGPLREMLTIETAYVAPGEWGASRGVIDDAQPDGPGWPGPGAVVQLLTTSPAEDPGALRQMVRDTAAELAAAMAPERAP
ncbi:MAG: hypothetical protein ACFCBV_09555 [Phycisphaerales bacterium]